MEDGHAVHDSPARQPTILDKQDVLDNIDGCMHGPMPGFINKFFGQSSHVHRDDGFMVQSAETVNGHCCVSPAAPAPDNFLQWFSNFASQDLDGDRASWHMLSNTVSADQKEVEDGASLLLTMPPTPASNPHVTWHHVQVVGQFYHLDSVSYQHGLIRLCQSAQRVFASQPTRLFLHGYYIRGSQMELWLFDRSGLYCSHVFDVQKDFEQFTSIIKSYGRMTDSQLGRLKLIQTDKDGVYITLDKESKSSLGKLYVERQPIACRPDLIGTGTTCYRARSPGSNDWNHVLKFKWRWARHRPEDELLRLAQEKCATGILSLDYYEEIETTADLRAGFRWGSQRAFSSAHSHAKHKGTPDHPQPTGLADYTEETDSFFQNHILTCVVTSPVGRPLHTFRSQIELLQAFRDAIKCHQSLYQDAKILHQDISAGNMVILDNQDKDEPIGMLIDLDAAIDVETSLEGECNIVGTRPFMAIGVLKNECHTYRHDLESFFYVFLWAIITNGAEEAPKASKLRQWSSGDWDELAARKSLDMTRGGLEAILEEFDLQFQPLKRLAERIWKMLFPLRDGAMWIGTDSSPEDTAKLYHELIYTFEEAIVGLQCGKK